MGDRVIQNDERLQSAKTVRVEAAARPRAWQGELRCCTVTWLGQLTRQPPCPGWHGAEGKQLKSGLGLAAYLQGLLHDAQLCLTGLLGTKDSNGAVDGGQWACGGFCAWRPWAGSSP